MRAVINIEGAVALLIVLLIVRNALRAPDGQGIFNTPDIRGSQWLLFIIPAAFVWTLTIPLVSDDFISIADALNLTPQRIVALFTIPETNRFFRPLGYLSLALDALWTGRSVALWHLAALLLHFANCALVYMVARQIGISPFFATAATLIFGIHGSRPEAVTWIAGRFDLLATLFVLATILLFLRGRYWIALVPALFALISKESAYVLPIVLLLVTDRPRWRRVVPFALLTGFVFLYRWHVLSGIGGYQTAANTPAILQFNVLRTANALILRLWATLFFPVNWSESHWWRGLALALGLAAYGAIALFAGRSRTAVKWLLFILVSALPVQHLLLIAADLERSRILYLPSVGFALFLGSALETLRRLSSRVVAASAIIVFQVLCLEHNLLIWRGVAEVARSACDSVATPLENTDRSFTVLGLPPTLRGVYFLTGEGMRYCLSIEHGVDVGRFRESNADIVFQWDRQTETMKH